MSHAILNDLSATTGALACLPDRTQVLRTIDRALRRHVELSHISLYLAQDQQLVLSDALPSWERHLPTKLLNLGEGAIGTTAQKNEIVYLPNTQDDLYFPLNPVAPNEKSLLCVPLSDGDQVLGVLSLTGPPHQFAPASTERQVVETFSHFVTMMLKNIQLLENIRETARMEAELKTAAAVQNALFPKNLPQVRNLELASFFQSATESGGDWYGFSTAIEDHLYVMIGDVTGHGSPAALVTATAAATCSTLEELAGCYSDCLSPSKLLKLVNKAVYKIGYPNYMMSFFIASIELSTGKITFSNAGHNFPIVLRANGRLKHLVNTNSLLGYHPDSTYRESTYQLEEGDTLFLYTDGLIENTNPHEEFWGERTLKHYLSARSQYSASQLVDDLVQEAYRFYNSQPLEDDLTMVALKAVAPFTPSSNAIVLN